jgi:hypothetical protein
MRLPLSGLSKKSKEERRARFQRALIHYEAKIGSQLFGPVPKGHHREFFCLDRNTWVWHEEWTDQNGKHQSLTTRYDVRPSGVLKSQGHMSYQALDRDELINFFKAVRLYGKRVDAEYAKMLGTA